MKRICFFSGDITREGGTERVAVMIANALAGQDGYEVLFLSLVEQKEQPFFDLHPGIRRYALGDRWIQPGPGYIPLVPKLRRFLKEHRPDVLMDIDIVLDVLSLPAAKGLDTKVLSWEHFNYEFERETLYRRLILRYSVRRSDYVVTLTEEDKRAYETHLGRRERISAIYNPMAEQRKIPAGDRENMIVTVGRLIHRKGVDLLARVAPQVLKRHRDWKWYVLGDGEDRGLLEDVMEREGLSGQLILTGTVRNVESYLERAKLFVMTSRMEGLPMVLLEAKTFRLPCVSFDIPTGPKEIIEDGINGYLIPPFDCGQMTEKLERLMEDAQLLEQFARQTELGMEKFQMDAVMDRWNEVLEMLCGYKKR